MDTQQLMPIEATLAGLFADGDTLVDTREHERPHVSCLTRAFAALVAGDFEGFSQELTDDVDVQLFQPPDLPSRRTASGREEARELVKHNFGALTDQQPELLSLTAQGDSVMLVGREAGKVRESGQPYNVHFVYHFRFQEGKIRQILQYTTLTDWAAPQPSP